MSRIGRIHDDYLDPDKHLWPDEGPTDEPEFDREPDAYGNITYSIGTDDDFWCFDYVVSKCKRSVKFDVTINSETGSFIMDGGSATVPLQEAINFAAGTIDEALSWCGENELREDEGFNYFEAAEIGKNFCNHLADDVQCAQHDLDKAFHDE